MAEVFDFGLQKHKIKMDGNFFENNLFAVAGDTGRRLELQLLDSNNLVQNTTGISLRLNANVAGQATYAEATLVDATKGLYELDLPNGMLIAPGNWQFQWQITDSAGKKLHSFAFMGSVGSNLSEGGSEATNFYLNVDDLKQMQEDLVNGTFDSEVLETNIAERLETLEETYAPRLTEVIAQLAKTVPYNIDRLPIFGHEYLSAYHKKIMTGLPTVVTFTGDSTTKGDGTTSPYRINEIFKSLCDNSGLRTTSLNNGRSGVWASSWASTHVTTDLATNPDLLVVRWGLNDARTDLNITDYKNAMRSGLTTVRNSRPVESLSIVLMTPNNVSSVQYPEKSTAWGKAVNAALRELAREFQCVFIDTFAIWNDAERGSDWLDEYLVHPENVANLWITSTIFDTVLPRAIREVFGNKQRTPKISTPTLMTNWTNFDGIHEQASYYKDSSGVVHLQGLITGGTKQAGTTIFTLPEGYAPVKFKYFVVATSSLSGVVTIGTVKVYSNKLTYESGENGWLSLDGISYLAKQN